MNNVRPFCSKASAVGDKCNWQTINVGSRATVTCYTGDVGISHTVGGNNTRNCANEDDILRGVGVMANGLDVDEFPSPETGRNRSRNSGRAT